MKDLKLFKEFALDQVDVNIEFIGGDHIGTEWSTHTASGNDIYDTTFDTIVYTEIPG